MRLGYPGFQAHEAEILAVTCTPPARGPQYHHLFKFVHPYLCDPGLATVRLYRLPVSWTSAALAMVRSLADAKVWRTLRNPAAPAPPGQAGERLHMPLGQLQGFFVIDKRGIVRVARAGLGSTLLPSNAEIVRALAGLSG